MRELSLSLSLSLSLCAQHPSDKSSGAPSLESIRLRLSSTTAVPVESVLNVTGTDLGHGLIDFLLGTSLTVFCLIIQLLLCDICVFTLISWSVTEALKVSFIYRELD